MTKDLPKKFINISIAAVIGGSTIGIIDSSPLSAQLKTGSSSLIGVGLLKGTGRLLK